MPSSRLHSSRSWMPMAQASSPHGAGTTAAPPIPARRTASTAARWHPASSRRAARRLQSRWPSGWSGSSGVGVRQGLPCGAHGSRMRPANKKGAVFPRRPSTCSRYLRRRVLLARSAPAAGVGVGLLHFLHVRHRADDRADLDLLVRLDRAASSSRRPPRPTRRSPRCPASAYSGSSVRQRQLLALVRAVADPGRYADLLAVLRQHLVLRVHRVHGRRELEVLGALASPCRTARRCAFCTSSSSSSSVTFTRCGLLRDLLERLATDELMVELDHEAVAQVVAASRSSRRCSSL